MCASNAKRIDTVLGLDTPAFAEVMPDFVRAALNTVSFPYSFAAAKLIERDDLAFDCGLSEKMWEQKEVGAVDKN